MPVPFCVPKPLGKSIYSQNTVHQKFYAQIHADRNWEGGVTRALMVQDEGELL